MCGTTIGITTYTTITAVTIGREQPGREELALPAWGRKAGILSDVSLREAEA